MSLHLMVINTYMKLDAQIHIRASQDFKNELAEQAKKNNTTISSILVSSYKRFKKTKTYKKQNLDKAIDDETNNSNCACISNYKNVEIQNWLLNKQQVTINTNS